MTILICLLIYARWSSEILDRTHLKEDYCCHVQMVRISDGQNAYTECLRVVIVTFRQ